MTALEKILERDQSEPCDEWIELDRIICHRSETDDGKIYHCGECGVLLSGPNKLAEGEK